MAMYINGDTIAYGALPVGAIEQVAVLPTVGGVDHLYLLTVPDATHEIGLYYFDGAVWHSTGSGGEGGTSDYNELVNKPRINGVELVNNISLASLDIAQASQTYTKVQVDELISSAQKVYLSTTPPTAANNVGLYYVDTTGTGSSYNIYLVDSNKSVAALGSASISLVGYQKEIDAGLSWTPTSTVVGSINDLKYRLDNLPSGGTITMNGVVTGSPTFYAPTTSGTFGQKLVSYGPFQAPQWVTDSGETGTKVHLNGSTAIVTETYIYAPTNSGVAGYVLKSQGENLPPQWVAPDASDSPTVSINGAVKEVSAAEVKFYAPLTGGTSGYILKAKGSGLAPVWEAPGEADGAYMTLNGTETPVTTDKVNIYAPLASGDKSKMLTGNASGVPTWETSCRSVVLTKAEYAALSETAKMDENVIYFVKE